MGVSSVTLSWFSRVQEKGGFQNKTNVLEMGPQDVLMTHEGYMLWLRKYYTAEQALAFEEHVLSLTLALRYNVYAREAYAAMGLKEYFSLDSHDIRSDWRVDLNYPVTTIPRKFDVITNIGTAEHVFNVAQVFVTCHELLEPNGVALHILPTSGCVDHGFYNIHPTLYFDIARYNGYEMVDFTYIDNTGLREALENGKHANPADFNFDDLPVKISDNDSRDAVSVITDRCMAKNMASPTTQLARDNINNFVISDCCYVAMRKGNNNDPFVFPHQGYYDR